MSLRINRSEVKWKSVSHAWLFVTSWIVHGILQARTGVDSLSLLQGIFPTQGLNPGFSHCRQILYQPSQRYFINISTSGLDNRNSDFKGLHWDQESAFFKLYLSDSNLSCFKATFLETQLSEIHSHVSKCWKIIYLVAYSTIILYVDNLKMSCGIIFD